MEFLIENIRKHVRLSDEEAQRVFAFFDALPLAPKTKLLTPGQICSASYFVESGILRSYYLDIQGNEHIVNFASPGWWIADMYSFLSGDRKSVV